MNISLRKKSFWARFYSRKNNFAFNARAKKKLLGFFNFLIKNSLDCKRKAYKICAYMNANSFGIWKAIAGCIYGCAKIWIIWFSTDLWRGSMNDNIKIVLSLCFFSFQALNGFLMILTCEGEVFFATHSIESYLGFHQVKLSFHIPCPAINSLSSTHNFDNARNKEINYIFQFAKPKRV